MAIRSVQRPSVGFQSGEWSGPAWVLAGALWVVGDILTTGVGFHVGAVEGNPLPSAVLAGGADGPLAAFLALAALKGVALTACVLWWRWFPVRVFSLPPESRVAVPGALALWGLFVVLYNTRIILLSL